MEHHAYESNRYFMRLATAFVLGKRAMGAEVPLLQEVAGKTCNALTEDQQRQVIDAGLTAGLRLHTFKRTMGLARVERVLGILRGLAPEQLLDVGSGRGVFLWPLLDAFPALPITATDVKPERVEDIEAVSRGGVSNLTGHVVDATRIDLPDGSFDVVTMLEVLEHIPDAQRALREAIRVARRFVVLSVPSQPDDNPEHLHLFDRAELDGMCRMAGAANVNFQYVLNHMIVVARVGSL